VHLDVSWAGSRTDLAFYFSRALSDFLGGFVYGFFGRPLDLAARLRSGATGCLARIFNILLASFSLWGPGDANHESGRSED